jgi:hypothetical protein
LLPVTGASGDAESPWAVLAPILILLGAGIAGLRQVRGKRS